MPKSSSNFLKRELEIERDRLLEKIFYKTLERIFIENRLYKKIETVKTLEGIHKTLEDVVQALSKKAPPQSPPTKIEKDFSKSPSAGFPSSTSIRTKKRLLFSKRHLRQVEKDLKNVKKFTINYLKKLIEKYGKDYPRKTRVKAIEEIDRRAIETKQIKVGFDPKAGFIGTKVSGPVQLDCTNFDKLLIFFKDGTYKVVNIPEKQYVENVAWVGIADKKTVMNVVYKNKETGQAWAKRFIVDKFILEKTYHYIDDLGELLYISDDPKATIEIQFVPQANQKLKKILYPFKEALVKGAQARGIRVATQKVKKVSESDQLLLV